MRNIGAGLLALTLIASGGAQNGPTPKVLIPLLVKGPHNRSVPAMTVGALVIRDQKTLVTDATLISAEDLPLDLGILIDTSASQQYTTLPDALKGVNEFVNSVVRPGDDRAFFLTFSGKPAATRWLKKDDLANVSIDAPFGRGTALYDSIMVACQQRFGPPDRQHPSRRVLIIISDGEDNSSQITRGVAESEVIRSGVVIFSVATLDSQMRGGTRGTKVLEHMATITAGESFSDLSRGDMPKAFATIKQLIEGMYYASYSPPKPGDAVHEVEVRPAAREKIKVAYPAKYAWLP